MKKLILTLPFLLIFCLPVHSETLTLSTYYPAPFGSYDRLRLVPRNVAPPCDVSLEGSLYYSDITDTINICQNDGTWGFLQGIWTQDALDNVYLTDTATNPNLAVGIGITAPGALLHVNNPNWNIVGDWTQSKLKGDVIISNTDAQLNLIGENASSGLASIHMTEVSPAGTATDSWHIMRYTTGNALPSSFSIGYHPTGAGNWFGQEQYQKLTIFPDGNVGIGTEAPESLLHLSAPDPVLYLKGSTGADYSATMRLAGENEDTWRGGYMQYDAGGDMLVIGVHNTADKLTANDTKAILIDRSTGNIGIQRNPDTTATDYELAVHGTIYADGADLAENILVEDNVKPGDVVVIAEKGDKKLKKSDQPYAPKIAGVISTDPGFCLGDYKEGYQPLALTGQVPVKVTTENGPIKKGDLLTSSSKPGYAMKAEFIPLGNIKSLSELTTALEENQKRQLAIIGKALEGFKEGEGTIVILMAR
ncbi:MAG: hypothetical protein KAJ70_00125 [Candidatus Omnitrophica bacterium]|nr:hypothetical protein [Candidatus Omnitrophota bacterium]